MATAALTDSIGTAAFAAIVAFAPIEVAIPPLLTEAILQPWVRFVAWAAIFALAKASVSLAIPLGLLPQLDPGELDWTMPGWQAEKITYFLHDLPKATRREVSEAGGTLGDVARLLAETLVPFEGPMMPALAKALSTLIGSRVTPDLFRPENAPRHLRFLIEVLDEGGRVVAEGRDPRTTLVSEIVTYDATTVSREAGIETAVRLMRDRGVRRLPIVTEDGQVTGIVTADDLMILLSDELAQVGTAIRDNVDASESR